MNNDKACLRVGRRSDQGFGFVTSVAAGPGARSFGPTGVLYVCIGVCVSWQSGAGIRKQSKRGWGLPAIGVSREGVREEYRRQTSQTNTAGGRAGGINCLWCSRVEQLACARL